MHPVPCKRGAGMGTHALRYFVLAEYRQKVVDACGKIVVEEVDMPGVGSFSLFEDPDGRVIGLWKQLSQKAGE